MRTLSVIFNILCIIALFSTAFDATAQKKKKGDTTPTDIHAVSKAENLAYPVVSEKQHKNVADYMRREAQAIVKQGYKVETERNGEVMVVTIPASKLFLPNTTELEISGQKLLEPFTAYLKSAGRFKIIMAMHSDDTGSEAYLEKLTEERLKSVMDFIEKNSAHPEQIVGYAMASDEPLHPNSNIANRAKNRRLEIYIVPDEEIIKQAGKR